MNRVSLYLAAQTFRAADALNCRLFRYLVGPEVLRLRKEARAAAIRRHEICTPQYPPIEVSLKKAAREESVAADLSFQVACAERLKKLRAVGVPKCGALEWLSIRGTPRTPKK